MAIINVCSKGSFDRFLISGLGIARKLNAFVEATGEIGNKSIGGNRITFADLEGRDKFRPFLQLLYSISAVVKPAGCVLKGDALQSLGDGLF